MKIICLLGLSCFALLLSCADVSSTTKEVALAGSFESVVPVLEHSCVHCHASQRLSTMPSFNDSNALAAIRGSGKLIVPGSPETSRFLVVTKLADDELSAMPPTGHALSEKEVETLRVWIQQGALLPKENVRFSPQGQSPRSR